MSKNVSLTQDHTPPYKGLRPYEEEDRHNFFGRDADCSILVDKILANRLTLLFAAAGAGKSSLLQAKVLSQLKDPHHENLDVVYYRDWVSSPLPALKQKILKTLKEDGRIEGDSLGEETKEFLLTDFFALCTLLSRQPLVVILDQFEEFFHNQRYTMDFKPFIKQLATTINDRTIAVAFIISMRQDFVMELNVFKSYIPLFLENYYLLQPLTKDSAQKAMEEPVRFFGFRYERALLDRLLTDLVWHDRCESLDTTRFDSTLVDMVDPVALQIVCSQLWEMEKTSSDKMLHLTTYENRGGAIAFFRSFLEESFKDFSSEKKYLAHEMFNHLITRRGSKVPVTFGILGKLLPATDQQLLKNLINDLQHKRILRNEWRNGDMWYEIYHDRFSDAIEKWSESYKNERARELSKFLDDFFTTVTQLSKKERKLTAKILNYLTEKCSTNENYSASCIAEQLKEEVTEIEKLLPQLEVMHIVRKNYREKGYALYDNLFSGPLKQWILDYRLRKKRIWRNIFFTVSVVMFLTTFVLYEYITNINNKHFYVSSKEEISENIEVYRGKPRTFGFPYWKKYMYETNYSRSVMDQERLFKEMVIRDHRQLNLELIGFLQPISRIEAYWKLGETDKAFDFIPQVIQKYPERKQSMIDILASFRSLETIDKLAKYLDDRPVDKELYEKIVLSMASLPSHKALNLLLQIAEHEGLGPRGRRYAVEAIESISRTDFGAVNAKKIKASLTSLLKPPPASWSEDEEAFLWLATARTLVWLGDQDAVKQLQSLLTKEENQQIRWGIMETFTGVRNDAFVQYLIEYINRRKASMQWGPVGALGQVGGPGVVEKLIELINHHSIHMRRTAVEALGRTGDPRASQALIARLKPNGEDEGEVRNSIIEALGRLGNSEAMQHFPAWHTQDLIRGSATAPDATQVSEEGSARVAEILWSMVRSEENSPMYRIALETMEQIATPEMCQMLIGALENKGDTRQIKVILQALGRLGDIRAIPPIIQVISSLPASQTDAADTEDAVRHSAIEALARLDAPEAPALLIDALRTAKGRSRLHVVDALGRLGDQEVLGHLKAILHSGADKQDPVYLSALVALARLGDASALRDLTSWLQRGDSLMRGGNLETLIGPYMAKWIESSISSQSREERYLRQTAVEALGRFDSMKPVDLLMTRLSDGSTFVRRGAVRALGQLGRREIRVIEPLIARLNDRDSDVRRYAAEALGQLGDARAVTSLIALLQDGMSDVRRYAAEALGRLGDKKALEHLLSQFKGEDGKRRDGVEDVRRMALLAYAKIGLKFDRERIGDEVRVVFKDKTEHERVRVAASVALLALHKDDSANNDIQTWLKRYTDSVQANVRKKELADMLGEFPSEVGTQLLFALLKDSNLNVQTSALRSLGLTKPQEALSELHEKLENPNLRLQKAAADTLAEIASAESINKLTAIVSNVKVSIPVRISSLNALHNIAVNNKNDSISREKAIAGMLHAIQSEESEALLAIQTYNLLGDLQARAQLSHLQKLLQQEGKRQHDWRSQRDALEDRDVTAEQSQQAQDDLKKAKSRPNFAFALAYNIARIAPEGPDVQQLLFHDLADIRQGAWLGLGKVGNVDLIGTLRQQWRSSKEPRFRHAVYQAIDHILLRLEAEKVNQQELEKLKALYPGEVGTLCKQGEEKGICLRVEWTIAHLQDKNKNHEQRSAEYSSKLNR